MTKLQDLGLRSDSSSEEFVLLARAKNANFGDAIEKFDLTVDEGYGLDEVTLSITLKEIGKLLVCLAEESGSCSVHHRCGETVECLHQVVRCSVVAAIPVRFVCTVGVL